MFIVQCVTLLALLSVSVQAQTTSSLNPGTSRSLAYSFTASSESCSYYPSATTGSSYTSPVGTSYWTPAGPNCPSSTTPYTSSTGVYVFIMPGKVDVSTFASGNSLYTWVVPTSTTSVCNQASTNYPMTLTTTGNYWIVICSLNRIGQGQITVTSSTSPLTAPAPSPPSSPSYTGQV